ncbi:unnamed protein product [Lymnaea stagnalis]|uniref:Transmembrane protein n=1 Tax=Lymnaea stagnalis TaxID=6523 RepID=A0AAV2HQ07_LYMST
MLIPLRLKQQHPHHYHQQEQPHYHHPVYHSYILVAAVALVMVAYVASLIYKTGEAKKNAGMIREIMDETLKSSNAWKDQMKTLLSELRVRTVVQETARRKHDHVMHNILTVTAVVFRELKLLLSV